MFRPAFSCAALFAVCVLALPAAAQTSFGHASVATVRASASPVKVSRGGTGTLNVTITVNAGFHVNAHKLSDPDLIPTTLSLTPAPGITWGAPRFPAAKTQTVAGKPAPVYTGRTTIAVPFAIAKTAKPGTLPLSATLSYQGCNASACFPPASAPVKTTVSIR